MNSIEFAHRFADLFGAQAAIFSAPGRVNLIGEHTDYNDGFVMPSAIGLYTRVAIAPRTDSQIVVSSEQFPRQFAFDLNRLPEKRIGDWCDYVLGIAIALQEAGHRLQGANVLVHSDIPIGGGLSSSAAIEVASALALMTISGMSLPPTELAKLCQRVENTFIGARCGIMDQLVSRLGKAGHTLFLDCRSLEFELIPIPENIRFVICNTMIKHQHAGGEYNRRRVECEMGVKLLSEHYPRIRALRDVSMDQLGAHSSEFPEAIFKRCRHVIEENERVRVAAVCLRRGDLNQFGDLMLDSHRSLRDLYQVSCRELDVMVESAEGLPGFCGGRMTGGGFGGSTINLVEAGAAEDFAAQISARYRKKTGIEPAIYTCSAANGANAENVSVT